MSRSVSAPSSVTKTSPCWNGFIVPGSTLRYGSSFCMTTRSPRAVRRLPKLAAVRPFPRDETTPPVTKMCLVTTAAGLTTTGFQHISRRGGHAGTRSARQGSSRDRSDAPPHHHQQDDRGHLRGDHQGGQQRDVTVEGAG